MERPLKKQLEDLKNALPLMIQMNSIDRATFKTLNDAVDEMLETLYEESLNKSAGILLPTNEEITRKACEINRIPYDEEEDIYDAVRLNIWCEGAKWTRDFIEGKVAAPKTKYEILEEQGWTIECQSPFEIRHEDGSFASGAAAHFCVDAIVEYYKQQNQRL